MLSSTSFNNNVLQKRSIIISIEDQTRTSRSYTLSYATYQSFHYCLTLVPMSASPVQQPVSVLSVNKIHDYVITP
jgi:hypothetical protein